MGLVADASIHLVVFNRLMHLLQVLLMAKLTSCGAGDPFYSLFLDYLGGGVCIFAHEDGIHFGSKGNYFDY